MERERVSLFLGLGVLGLGIAILLVVLGSAFAIATAPAAFVERNLGSQASPPRAFYAWTANNTTVRFQDLSSAGTAAIASYEWSFGDNATSTERDPTHTFTTQGAYFVRLTVQDADGREGVAAAQLNLQGGTTGGTSEGGPGDLGFGSLLVPLSIVLLSIGLHLVSVVAGASLVKAGWNLIRPRPETIRIKLKPRHLEEAATAEVVTPTNPMTIPAIRAIPSATPPPPES